ncbi:MAG: tail fiber domain-containing protein [Betaproteobacteria bacterium]|nr:tail fiber domain-containing protein [Betaproteobacteria bacterium]
MPAEASITCQGNYSAVLGGNNNQVLGNYSLAGGRWAKASWAGQTVIADSVDLLFDPAAQGNWGGNGTNTFNVRATAGALFVTAIDGGGNTVKRTWFGNDGNAYTTGTFVNGSDRAAKERFAVVAARDVLERVAGLPVTKWSYKGQTQRHMGPMAQDFRAAFGLGHDDTTISTVDAAGVALAAIQGLHQLVREKDRELQRLRAKAAEVDALKRDLAAIKERLGMR